MPHQSTFQPVHPFNLDDPKSWAQTAGTMDWDTTHICFTKRSLLDFLKQVGVSVGTNYTEISKLPKYATFGKFSQAATNQAVKDLVDAEIADPSSADKVHTTRKVTQSPGGPTSVTISGADIEEQDALSMAPPRKAAGETQEGQEEDEDNGVTFTHTEKAEVRSVSVSMDGDEEKPPGAVPGFRPTRKVREGKAQTSHQSISCTDRQIIPDSSGWKVEHG
ncbi:hypothetical protein QFC21_006832 [Naganishia friedmannii]|uniref:Uncharacterized protein n=1 Tax=Naganishia friedmannii TaxID=89922 RepID=A0ACC2V000_9TREE|nr:hypothetical protein QFC21_006832 [Naganishia friedmannii]